MGEGKGADMEKEESEFFEWLRSKGLSQGTLRDYATAARRLGIEDCECDFACIRRKILKVKTSKEKRVVQNYITFCVDFMDLLDESKARKLRRSLSQIKKEERKFGVEEVRLSLEDINDVTQNKLKARPYLVFQYFSGLRLKEVLMVRDLLQKEKVIEIDEEYGYLPIGIKRGYKIAMVAFAPLDAFELLKRTEPINYDYIKKIGLARKIREHWFQRCVSISGYPQLCSWMQGRVSSLGVSEQHYLDLLNKAKLLYPRLAKALRGELEEDDMLIKVLLRHLELLRNFDG